MPEPYILFFDQCRLKDVSLMGGKGANLGELSAAGFPVPPGFGVTSAAFEAFLSANDLDAPLRQLVASIDFTDHRSVEEITAKIRGRMTAAALPEAIARDIGSACEKLGAGTLVAVRSSSAVPDLQISSFPGQMDTFYNLRSLDEILRYVQLCWTSVWTSRAAANRWNMGIDHFGVKVCALVQQMVPSEFSGVIFTSNPVTLADELVIEAIPGLGEALVSGQVNPEAFVLDKTDLRMLQRPETSVLPAEIILEAARMAREIEKHYGNPQDIEWAYAGGKLYALQTRAIRKKEGAANSSGLERWNKPAQAGEAEIIWTRAWSDEVLTRAITPLFYSVQADLITTTYDFIYRSYGLKNLLPMKLMRFHKNRGYFSTPYLKECLRYAPQFVRGEDALKFFPPEQKEEVKNMPFLLWPKLWSEVRFALLHRKYTLTRCHKTYSERWLPELRRRVRQSDSLDLETATSAQLESYFHGMDRLMKQHCEPIGIGVMVHTFAAVSLLGTLLKSWLGEDVAASTLLSGLPGNSTVELNQELWNLSRRIKQDMELALIFLAQPPSEILTLLNGSEKGRALAAELNGMCRRYDFRGAEDRELSFPRWGDDSGLMLSMLKLLIQAGDESAPDVAQEKNRLRREEMTRNIAQTLGKRPWGFLKKRVFQFLLKYAQIYSLFRENQRFEADRMFYGQRKAFLAIGRRLVRKELLADPGDIWFLSKEEVFDLLNGVLSPDDARNRILPRTAEYRRFLHNPPPMFLQGDREWDLVPEAVGDGDARLLTGVAASSGRATGVARVVRDIRELSRVRAGDILVTNSTDPGWTPVFLLIRGLILETGGILAHGTVLSREYGIPAVTSLKNATALIKEGDLITVDGSQGTVSLPA
jgi:pyruvate,water dikinase